MLIETRISNMQEKLREYRRAHQKATEEMKSLHEEKNSKLAEIERQRKDALNSLQEKENSFMMFYNNAKTNSRKELVISKTGCENVDLGNVDEVLRNLNSMLRKINESLRDDNVAGQVIDICSEYISRVRCEDDRINRKYDAKLYELEQLYELQINRCSAEKKRSLEAARAYMQGQDTIELKEKYDEIESMFNDCGDSSLYFSKSKKRIGKLLMGYFERGVSLHDDIVPTAKAALGKYFNSKNRTIMSPLPIYVTRGAAVCVEYSDKSEKELFHGVQTLVLNIIRYFNHDEFKISIVDSIYNNGEMLGPLRKLSLEGRGYIESIPNSESGARNKIASLAREYREINDRIDKFQGCVNVEEYNRRCDPKDIVPYRLLIVNEWMEEYSSAISDDLMYLLNNANKFGITLIGMLKSNIENQRENKYCNIKSDILTLNGRKGDHFTVQIEKKPRPFRWLSFDISSNLADELAQSVREKIIGTKYSDRYDILKCPRKSTVRITDISVPFAITTDDKEVKMCFDENTVAAYIMGATRSGKTTTLHTIISGLILNYHPDELELWIADLKTTEFTLYKDHCPPHLKYLLLDTSRTLSLAFIDKIYDEFVRRKKILSTKWGDIKNVPRDEYMPYIFVIIDEFKNMAELIRECDYRYKLEELLMQSGSFGFKFIFSSQTYSYESGGLTPPSKNQIRLRLALRNTERSEIRETLELPSGEVTPELENHINNLQDKESIFRRSEAGRNRVDYLKNMYVDVDNGELKTIIGNLNIKLQPTKSVDREDNHYVDKERVIVFGNELKTYGSQVKLYKKDNGKANLTDGEVLIYPGTPCSFTPTLSLRLENKRHENILMVGDEKHEQDAANIILSVLKTYKKNDQERHIEIWVSGRSILYNHICDYVSQHYTVINDEKRIFRRIEEIFNSTKRRVTDNRLIIVLGFSNLYEELQYANEVTDDSSFSSSSGDSYSDSSMNLSQILDKLGDGSLSDEDQLRYIDEYNRLVDESNDSEPRDDFNANNILSHLRECLRQSPRMGTHFLFHFNTVSEYVDTIQNEDRTQKFNHKIVEMLSSDESYSVFPAGSPLLRFFLSTMKDGMWMYVDRRDNMEYELRPHEHK